MQYLPLLVLSAHLALSQVVTTGTGDIGRSCTQVSATIFGLNSPEPTGALQTAVSASSLCDLVAVPNRPCDALQSLAATLYPDYIAHEAKIYTWWSEQKSSFSSWPSSCTGRVTASGAAEAIAVYLDPTNQAFLNTFTPATAIGCSTATVTPTAASTQQASPGSSTAGAEPTAMANMGWAAALGMGAIAIL